MSLSLLFSVVNKDVYLPPKMFEDILSKGTEMCWPVPHEYLKACLSRRESLYWMKIDLTFGLLKEGDLLVIAKSNFPVKCLSFRTYCMTNAMMEVIEKISPNLEVLEISMYTSDWDILE